MLTIFLFTSARHCVWYCSKHVSPGLWPLHTGVWSFKMKSHPKKIDLREACCLFDEEVLFQLFQNCSIAASAAVVYMLAEAFCFCHSWGRVRIQSGAAVFFRFIFRKTPRNPVKTPLAAVLETSLTFWSLQLPEIMWQHSLPSNPARFGLGATFAMNAALNPVLSHFLSS